MTLFVETARPKVNLTLRILGRRADGYHALESLVAFADGPADIVSLDCGEPRGITVTGPFAGGIAGPNLLATVLELASAAAPAGSELRLGHVRLAKTLPVAAGIGGGSADAAALLRAVRRANPDAAAAIDWHAIALRLGADVPVCLLDRAAFMTGIGDNLQPIARLPGLPAVLVNPQVAVPDDKTAQVFRRLGAPQLSGPELGPEPPGQLTRDALIELIDGGNDLEAAARRVVPAIGAVLEELRASSRCRVAAMSGAGPTCFGIFDDMDDAKDAAEALAVARPRWWVAASVLG